MGERSHYEVRLFGSQESTEKAAELLENMALECSEDEVLTPTYSMDELLLQAIATKFGVTLLKKGDRCISVLGLRDSVSHACAELRQRALEQVAEPIAASAVAMKDRSESADPYDSPKEDLCDRTPHMHPSMAPLASV